MAQGLPAGLRGYIAGQDKAAAQDARQFQNFGQALGMTGQIMQVQDMMRARQDEEQMRQLFRESGGDLKTMRDKAYQSGFYKQGMQFDQTLRKQQEEDLKRTELLGKIDKQKRDQLAAVNDSMGAAYEHAYTVYQTLQRGKVPEQMARAEAQKAWSAARGGLAQDPLMQGAQLPEEFDPDRALLALSQSKRTKELFDRFHKQETFAETQRSNQAREDAKRIDQGIARGNLSVSQGNLSATQQRLDLERQRFQREGDPTFLQRQEQAKVQGRQFGEATAQAQINLPQATATAERAIRLVDDILKHPGFKTTVGATLFPGARFIPGTDAADFQARMDEIKGGAFLQAFETLKGGGQITEVEGRKATEAIMRMSIAQSEKEFRTAAKEFQQIATSAMRRAQAKAGQPTAAGASGSFQAPSAPSGGIKFLGFE